MLKLAICCGTLSSSTRKLFFGMPGRKCPLLSRTATSSSTVLVSLVKVGLSAGSSLFFLLNLDGIFGSSLESSGGAVLLGGAAAGSGVLAGGAEGSVESITGAVAGGRFFFLGLATVSDESDPGSCACANRNDSTPNRISRAAAIPALKYFMTSPLKDQRKSRRLAPRTHFKPL